MSSAKAMRFAFVTGLTSLLAIINVGCTSTGETIYPNWSGSNSLPPSPDDSIKKTSAAPESSAFSIGSIFKSSPVKSNRRHPNNIVQNVRVVRQPASTNSGVANSGNRHQSYPTTHQPVASVAKREHLPVDPSFSTESSDSFYNDPWKHRASSP